MSEAELRADMALAKSLSSYISCLAEYCEAGEEGDKLTHGDLMRLFLNHNLPRPADKYLRDIVARAFSKLPDGRDNPRPPEHHLKRGSHHSTVYKFLRLKKKEVDLPPPAGSCPPECGVVVGGGGVGMTRGRRGRMGGSSSSSAPGQEEDGRSSRASVELFSPLAFPLAAAAEKGDLMAALI
jgi:hypothetical protein